MRRDKCPERKRRSKTAGFFDRLTPTEFESFCYDLLPELGFHDVDWRKGTPLPHSPSDRGRDLVATLRIQEIRGSVSEQKWFVECKHMKKGVPPEKLQNGLTWARAEKPDKLVFALSGFLSNNAKDYLEKFVATEKPSFKIEWWEGPKLTEFALGTPKLLRRYRLGGEYPFLDILHPAHIQYIRNPPRNSLDYLFRVLDGVDLEMRNNVMTITFMTFVHPSTRKPRSSDETIRDLITEPYGYAAFKTKCYDLSQMIDEFALVQCVITFTLSFAFRMGDLTRVSETIENNRRAAEEFARELSKNPPEDRARDLRVVLKGSLAAAKEAPERVSKCYKQYVAFCDSVVLPLFAEELKIHLFEDSLSSD